jgi:hypothetical protein
MGARKLVTLAVVAVILLLAARYLFWNDRRDIRRQLNLIAETASVSSSETPEEKAAKAAQLGAFVTDDVIIRTDASVLIGGRPAVVRLVMDAAATRRQVRLSIDEVQVELVDPSTATVFFTLNIHGDDPQIPDPVPRQVHAVFLKDHGGWLLTRGEVLRTLK